MSAAPAPAKGLTFSNQTREHLEAGKAYFKILCQPNHHEDGIASVPDLPGALCYDTGKPGKTAAIMLGTHMNELAGFTSAAHFHARWQAGERPASGKVYVMVGGHVPTIANTFVRLLGTTPYSEDEFLTARTRIMSSGADQHPSYFNHNILPLAFRDHAEEMAAKDPLYARMKKITDILSTCDAGVVDIHTTSQPSRPTVSPLTQPGDNDNTTLAKLQPVIEGMGAQYITLLQEHNLINTPAGTPEYDNTNLPLRAFAKLPKGAVALVIETGQHLDKYSFTTAMAMQDAWLHNVIDMPAHAVGMESSIGSPHVLAGIQKLYHPNVLKSAAAAALPEAVRNDRYFLIHDMDMLKDGPIPGLQWSPAARVKIAEYKSEHRFGDRHSQRLGFDVPVAKGEVLAIGLNTGHAVTAPADGHVLLVNKNPDLSVEQESFGYIATDVAKGPKRRTPSLSFCTTCMGRLEHLKQTLPKNLHDNPEKDVQFVVVNYGGDPEMESWIKRSFPDEIHEGRLKYVSYPAAEYFHMAHAKNMAHRLADGRIVCNLDADQFTGPGFASYIVSEMRDEKDEHGKPVKSNIYCRHDPVQMVQEAPDKHSSLGKIAVKKADFDAIRGYDESISGWGDDDRQLIARLTVQRGLRAHAIPMEFAHPIQHSDEVRLENYSPAAQSASQKRLNRNKDGSQIGRLAGKAFRFAKDMAHAAVGGPVNEGGYGSGEVFVNFSQVPEPAPDTPVVNSKSRAI